MLEASPPSVPNIRDKREASDPNLTLLLIKVTQDPVCCSGDKVWHLACSTQFYIERFVPAFSVEEGVIATLLFTYSPALFTFVHAFRHKSGAIR